MSVYDRAAATAVRILEKYGQAVTLSRPSTGTPTYVEATGVSTPAAPASYAGRGAVIEYAQNDIDGSLIQQGDQRLLLSPLQSDGTAMPVPDTSDNVIISGVTFAIKGVKKIAPAGVIVVFDLQMRGVA